MGQAVSSFTYWQQIDQQIKQSYWFLPSGYIGNALINLIQSYNRLIDMHQWMTNEWTGCYIFGSCSRWCHRWVPDCTLTGFRGPSWALDWRISGRRRGGDCAPAWTTAAPACATISPASKCPKCPKSTCPRCAIIGKEDGATASKYWFIHICSFNYLLFLCWLQELLGWKLSHVVFRTVSQR